MSLSKRALSVVVGPLLQPSPARLVCGRCASSSTLFKSRPVRFSSTQTHKQLTKDDLTKIEAGSHPELASLSSIGRTTHGEKTQVAQLQAPHVGAIKILTLKDPPSMNALGRVLVEELSEVVESIHHEASAPTTADSTRVLILASDLDKAFCAGANLKERAQMTPDETRAFLTCMRGVFARLQTLPVPCIAAVNGVALGGGLELALRAHARVFASNVQVGTPETRLGIIPGAGATFRLPELVGQPRALDMVLSGRRLGAAEALSWGLCTRVAGEAARDDGAEGQRLAVLKEAVKLAGQICLGAPVGVSAALQAMVGGAPSEEAENAAYERVLATGDRNEALKAFAEKRVPRFEGR